MLNPQPVIEVDLDGRVCYRNDAARQLLPDSVELAIDHPFLANWAAVVDACRRGADLPIRTVPMGDRWYEQVMHCVQETQRVRIYSLEITERKRAEEALNEERHLFRTLMDNLPDSIYFKDREGRFTRINEALAKGLNLDHPALAVGKTDFDFFAEEHAREFYNDEEKIIRTGQPMVGKEEKVIWPGGQVAWDSTTKMPLRDAHGNIVGTFGVSRDITERKRAEDELLQSEARLKEALLAAQMGVWEWTAETDIVIWDENLYRIAGRDPKLPVPTYMQHQQFYAPESWERLKAAVENSLATGAPYELDLEMVRPDGSKRWVIARGEPSRDANDRITRRRGTVQDITERKRAEEALRLTQFSVEHASDAIFWMDPQGRILYVNEAACRSVGRSREELLSLSIPDIDPLVPKDAWGTSWEAVKARGSVVLETQHQTKQGWVFPVEVTANYLEFGGKEYSFAFARDMTERKRAEAEHVRLVTAIEQSAEAVLITNTSGDIEYVNPAFSRITGYSREEALGQNPRILKSGNQDPALYQQLWETILQGKDWHGELINRRKDGSLYHEQMNVAAVRGERGEVTHFIATKQDITARKELEQRFVQAQKMEAVGRLAGGVAHDFNNLLTVSNGYAQILTQRSSPKDPRRSLFEEIQMAGERAASLTRQLLAFSRRQVMEPRVLDLSSVLANIEKMLRRLIGEDIELATNLKPGLGRVKVDPGQIEQVIMNLAVNARDAMPRGGKFFIETANVEVDEDFARSHKPMTPGKYVMISVSDTGCGMDLATQAHMFEPFFTTKVKGKGTGLGLATVYGII
jgi:PAS domain S-box-containing protein